MTEEVFHDLLLQKGFLRTRNLFTNFMQFTMKNFLNTNSETFPRQSLLGRKSNIQSTLKITTMKKLILLFLGIALFFTGNSVFGQATHNSYPIPLTGCTTGPLNPIAGVSYNYSAIVDPTGGTFQWWATTNQNFMAGGTNNVATALTVASGELLATSANYANIDPADNVDITWSSATLAAAETTPTFVVVEYDAPATGCANNLKVLLIDPVLGFTVDIRNMYGNYDTVAYGLTIDTCVSPVESATYNTTNGGIDYDFGDNQLLFEVVLANFSDSATLSFSISDLTGSQLADLAWGYTPATAGANVIGTGGYGNGVVPGVAPIVTDETNTGIGVSVFILATVHNNTYEGIVNTDFTLAVNAVNAEGDADVLNTDCTTQTDFEDMATQTLLERPEVTDNTPPAGDDFLPVNP